jgi:hypothetical protein
MICCCCGRRFSYGVYLLSTVIHEGQLVSAAVVVIYVYILLSWLFFDCGVVFIRFVWHVFGYAS